MKHAVQVLNYEKRKLINRLYDMQFENDCSQAQHADEDFQAVKRKISQTDDAIKLIESTDRKPKADKIQSRGTTTVRKG